MKKIFIVLGLASLIFACNSSTNESKSTDEKKADTPVTQNSAAESPYQKGLELVAGSDCTTCHKIKEKNIGPAYADVAKKYEATEANIDSLAGKVIRGGTGVWGTVPMTPHPNISQDDAREMVKYVLSLKNQ